MTRQEVGIFPLLLGHRADHGLDALELLLPLLEHAVIDLVHARDHFHQTPQRAHALDQAHLLHEVREIKRRLLQLLLHLFDVGEFDLLLGLLHQRQHITHAEDAAGHPFGMERLQGLHLLAGADELDRLTAHLADRKGGTTAGITIKLGEHRSGDAHLVVEGAGEFGRFLTDHRIHHQQHLIGLHSGADPHHLLHHLGVDLEATGGVDQERVEPFLLRLGQTSGRNVFRFGLSTEAEHLHIDLSTERFQLLDGGWSVNVGAHHQGSSPLILEVEAQLGRCGGFTGTLKAGHQHDGGSFSRLGQRSVIAPHDLHELFMDHLDELLIRADPAHHLRTNGFVADLSHELLHHRQADVGFQQGPTDVLQGSIDVGFADAVLATQPLDRILKTG